MKPARIPVSNRLQAVETILDSSCQRADGPNVSELRTALKLVRSLQRTLVGRRYVREQSLKRFTTSGADPKKRNWRRHQRERAVRENGRLV